MKEDFTDPKAEAGAPSEVDKFRTAVWPDLPVFLDSQHQFYKALGGGKRTQSTLSGFLAKLLNPFCDKLVIEFIVTIHFFSRS